MFGEVDFVRSGVVLMLMLLSGKTQKVIPSQYVTYQSEGVPYYSANGSSPTGHCSAVIMTTISGYNVTNCTAPSSSVLFDGIIPILTGLDGNMWACHLLTLYIGQSSRAFIYFDLRSQEEYAGVHRVEVVIFNCPNMGIAAEKIDLTFPSSLTQFNNVVIGTTSTPMNTSCDSLVTVNILCSMNTQFCNKTLLALEIFTDISSLVYIAEVRICGANNCPAIQTTTTTTDTICAKPTPSQSVTMTTPISPDPSVSTLITQQNTTSTSDKTDLEINILPIILPVVLLLLILVCVVGVVLLLWRCYCAKHHKHNTTALGEGTHASPHPHSHPPPITLCEETGQALYSVVQDEAGENSHYSHLQHGTDKVRGRDKIHEADTAVDQLYAEVDKKRSKKKDAKAPASDANTPVDQLYAHVNKKKSKKKSATDPPSEIESAVDQLYAQVDKKKIKKKDTTSTTHYPSETEAAVDQLYAQVDKKKSKKKSKDMDNNFAEKPEAVYSVVNKPRPPPKSDLLTEDENEPPSLPLQSNLLMED